MPNVTVDQLRGLIRDVPDFPKPGILFKDITPLLLDGPAFHAAIGLMAERAVGRGFSRVAAVESRGFIFGAALAMQLGVGFVPIRKRGKLPYKTTRVEYALEYGTDVVEMHVDAVETGHRVLLVDDLLATGGTARAGLELLKQQGAELAGCMFLIELRFLGGRDRLPEVPVDAIMSY